MKVESTVTVMAAGLTAGGVAKSLADFERMAAQSLEALPGLHRQKMRQHASGDTIGHQSGKMSSELVQLRCHRQCEGQLTQVSL